MKARLLATASQNKKVERKITIMMNMRNSKKAQMIARVIIIVIIVAMLVGGVASFIR